MRILILGAGSFAASGLRERLQADGHDVLEFRRGAPGLTGGALRGDVLRLPELAALTGPLDVVINYIVLKDQNTERNLGFMGSLCEFCRAAKVRRLVQISSISVYPSKIARVDEGSPIETNLGRKGSYAALKVVADAWLLEQELPFEVALVRPGFVMAAGLASPIVGMGFRLPNNRVLVFGSGRVAVPLIRREQLHAAVAAIVMLASVRRFEVFHAFDGAAPTRAQFVRRAAQVLSLGSAVWWLPALFWYGAGFAVDVALRLIGRPPAVLRSIRNSCARQIYSAAQTEQRLGMKFVSDVDAVLRESIEGQELNFRIDPVGDCAAGECVQSVCYLGAGRIVRTAHLAAVDRMGIPRDRLHFYDLADSEESFGRIVSLSRELPAGDGLTVVATPATAHVKALRQIDGMAGPVLIEKPLALNPAELDAWLGVAAAGRPVLAAHNYRFKANVRAFRRFVAEHPSGRLVHAQLTFQSPPVAADASPWIRAERESRSLLMDYAVHFLDLACMFSSGPWQAGAVHHSVNRRGETETIDSLCASPEYQVGFTLRQGFMPRVCRIEFLFQNYTAVVSFFPDAFWVRMTDENFGTHAIAARATFGATVRKVVSVVTGKQSDTGHAACYRIACGPNPAEAEISVKRLESFYRMIFAVGDQVYGTGGGRSGG